MFEKMKMLGKIQQTNTYEQCWILLWIFWILFLETLDLFWNILDLFLTILENVEKQNPKFWTID